MKILDACITFVKWAISICILALIVFIAWQNVLAYERALIGIGVGRSWAIWIGAAVFGAIQGLEVMPILLTRKHNDVRDMLSAAEKVADSGQKSLLTQLKEEQELRPRLIIAHQRRATVAYFADAILSFFFVFPVVTNWVLFWATKSFRFISGWNLLMACGTVWLLPWLVKQLVSEPSDLNPGKMVQKVREFLERRRLESSSAGGSGKSYQFREE